jgi:uncharacterized protein (DUF2141 family)
MRLIAKDPGDVRSPKRLLRLATAILAAAWASGHFAFAQETVPEKRCEGEGSIRILVRVQELRSSSGLVTVELFNDNPKGFIKKLGRLERIRVNAANGEAKACFLAPGPGTYAIALYHDENGNKKFDRNFIGIPTEGFGFSNNPGIVFGPPEHAEAAFDVGDDPVELKIKVRYL